MNNNIVSAGKKSSIDRKNIKSFDYTRSLLAEAARIGAITKAEETAVQAGFINMLGVTIENYTRGESSSVAVETANRLFAGVLFQIDTYLRSLNAPDTALEILLKRPLAELRDEGVRLIRRTVNECMTLLMSVRRSRLPVINGTYDDVLNGDIKNALKKYDALFFPQDIAGGTDYPLSVMPYGQRGIFYLRTYLLNLSYENDFCRAFESEELDFIYKLFCAVHKSTFNDTVTNIYTLVYANALFCEYLKKDCNTLVLTKRDCDIAGTLLYDLSEAEQKNILMRCADALPSGKHPYHQKTMEKLLPSIINAIKNQSLENFLICVE